MPLLIGILTALLVVPFAWRLLVRLWVNSAAKQISKQALARQPDHIHLSRCAAHEWRGNPAAGEAADLLVSTGFKDAGIYTIDELDGVKVQLLVKAEDDLHAAIYEHPRAGSWFAFTSRYKDGTTSTFTSAQGSGLDSRPGHSIVHDPTADPVTLYARACRDRPRGELAEASVEIAVQAFEQAFADGMAWRKSRGVSVGEIARVAARKKAA